MSETKSENHRLTTGQTTQAKKRRRLGDLATGLFVLGLMATSGGGCSSCKKDTEPEPIPAPPSPGGASQDTVNTRIGTGLGFGSSLAPTSTKWERVFVTGPLTAVVVGRSLDEAIALRTTDGGRTWDALKTKPGNFASWGVGADGSAALIGGDTKKVKLGPGERAPVIKANVWFAPADRTLSESAPLFPNDDRLTDISIERGFAMPAVLSSELAAVVADQNRTSAIVFGAPGGQPQPDAIAGERDKIVTAPFGRPPQMLTESGGGFSTRPWPKPGEKLQSGTPIPGLTRLPGAYEQLSDGPGCEFLEWSFARVGSPQNAWIVGVSEKKSFAFKAPTGEAPAIGCGADAVVVEVFDKEKKGPQLLRCTFDGKCSVPQSPPFDVWTEKHERKITSVATNQGIVAVMSARSGARWGTYLGTSMDGGKTFDLPRVIGEGSTDRGFFEIGALIAFPERVVILLSADVTGTRRRGWYALASEDGGQSWREP